MYNINPIVLPVCFFFLPFLRISSGKGDEWFLFLYICMYIRYSIDGFSDTLFFRFFFSSFSSFSSFFRGGGLSAYIFYTPTLGSFALGHDSVIRA